MVWPDIEVTMSPGLLALPPGMFSVGGIDADDVERQLHAGHGLHGAEHAGGAAHVVLHLVHFGGRLERDAAGVEGDALADQHDWACRPALPP